MHKSHRTFLCSVPSSTYWITWLLLLAAFAFVPTVMDAQTAPACPANTATYPCVYVANGNGNNVSVISAPANQVIGAVPVGNFPLGAAITPDNKSVYVANSDDGSVSVIDTATGVVTTTITTLSGAFPTQIAASPDGKSIFVVEPSDFSVIEQIDIATNTVVGSITGTIYPVAIAFDPNGKLAYVADECAVSGPTCVDVVDLTQNPPAVTGTPTTISFSVFSFSASIAVSADGSVVCLLIPDPNFNPEIAFVTTSNNAVSQISLGVTSSISDYGLVLTPNGIVYAAAPGTPSAVLNVVVPFTTNPQAILPSIQVGQGPVGIAVGSGASSLYVTNASDNTVSVINTSTNAVLTLSSAGFSNPQGVAAMSVPPPVITTQPASQTILTDQTATLSVVATSQTTTLAYQWFQGVSGDMSAPIKGATGSSFITPALSSTTSYWVLVGNIAGTVSSNTATVTVTTVTPPVITTQPASQTILTSQTATLSVVATSQATLAYQWFRGLSGDTSLPVPGATGSAFTTPPLSATTSYWVQVVNLVGSVNSSTATITVTAVVQNPPACAPNTANYPCVYVANGSGDTVSVINATTNKVIGAVTVGKLPQDVAITPDNASVYVAIGSPFSVAVIDTATGTVTATVTGLTGDGPPSQLAVTPDGKYVYVVEPGSDVHVIDRISTATNIVVDSVFNVSLPSAIVFDPGGKLAYVPDLCLFQIACVDLVDTTTNPPRSDSSLVLRNSTLNITQTGSIAITPDGSIFCVTEEDPNFDVQVECSNMTTQTLTELDLGIGTGITPYGLAVAPNGTMYAVEPGEQTLLNTVAVINPSTAPPTLLSNIQVGSSPRGVAVGPGGSTVYVTNTNDSTIAFIDAATNGVVILGSGNGFSGPVGVASMTAIPPVIATQPASQAIFAGQTATMSVVATSTAPLSYQWYQGQSGDTSAPIVGASGSSFTTPALTSTTSYWVQIINVAGTVNSNTATITVPTVNPPVITTQPASQLILTGQTATLSVAATSTVPLSYQWYQGVSGDTSSLIAGASASSFTTPVLTSTTSYWVQVANPISTVNSNTATVTVTTNQPPTCTLSVVGAGLQSTNPLTVNATANCADPQGEALITIITFGDGASSSGSNTGVFTATHTYAAYTQQKTYGIQVTATDTFGLTSVPAVYSWNLVPTTLAPPVFGGQTSTVTVILASPSGQPETVQFECTTVTTVTGSNPVFTPASDLGISCSSNPATVTLTAVSQPVKIVIQTTGEVSAQMRGMRQGMFAYAFWMPLPFLIFLGAGFRSTRFRRSDFWWRLALAGLIVLAFLSVSCGGGFTAPNVIHATPAGNYQVTVIDVPAGSTTNSGFVQTSLIVPLTVSPFQ